MVHSTHRSSLYFCPLRRYGTCSPKVFVPAASAPSCFSNHLPYPAPPSLPPQLPPPQLPIIVDIPYSSSHRNSRLAPLSPPPLSVRRSPTGTHAHTHTHSNAVQTDIRRPSVEAAWELALSQPTGKASWPTAKDGHLGCLLLFVTEQKGLRSGSLGILPACLPYTLKPHRTRHLLLSSFERLLQHINSSSCASLDYIYPTSSLSLSLSLNLQPQYLGPHIASPCIPTKAAPIVHLKQSSEEVVFPALPLFRSASSRPPR